MLTALYTFLLRRRTRAFPPQVAREMLAAFHEAREDAARQGLAAYLRFSTRELAGVAWPARGAQLHAPPKPHSLRWVTACALAGGIVAGAIVYTKPPQYTSTATIRIVPSSLPEQLLPSIGRTDLKRQLQVQIVGVLSRQTLTEMIRVYELYPSERARMTLYDVAEEMRKYIAFRYGEENMLQIMFTYETPREAQKVTRDLMTRVIDASIRQRSQELKSISMFLSDRSESAAKTWLERSVALRKMKENEPQYARASLDVELARKEYQVLQEKIGMARTAEAAASWKYDATLEVIDLPSLPEREQLNRPLIIAVGAFAGLLVGLLITWIRSIRPPDLMAPAATSA